MIDVDVDKELLLSARDVSSVLAAMNSTWTAAVHPRFTNITVASAAQLLGVQVDPGLHRPAPRQEFASVTLPSAFDARQAWPHCPTVSHVRDQGLCGSCWAFAATEAFNDRLCIASGGQFPTTLSAWQTTSCGESSFGCLGGDPLAAWDYIQKEGLATGGGFEDIGTGKSCLPYPLPTCAHHVNSSHLPDCEQTKGPEPSCPGRWKCSEANYTNSFDKDVHGGAGSPYSLSGAAAIKQDIALKGPVSAIFAVYEDFFHYSTGVYQHVAGKGIGEHAVKILGWGAEGRLDYWLVANSWNAEWGDDGFFKIEMGECGIDSQSVNAAVVSFHGLATRELVV